MCGIAGVTGASSAESIVEAMLARFVYRGPDDSGAYADGDTAIGIRRLSIIDVEGGHQPFFSEDGRYAVVANGEIYNHHDLRAELIAKGHTFVSASDCETLVHLYEEMGERSVERLRGMFAYAVHDTVEHKLFIARDAFGIKPLYFYAPGGKFSAFASEIKSLLTLPDFKADVNDQAIYSYLSFQYNPHDETFFKDVFKLPPAHSMTVDLDTAKFTQQRYWRMHFEPDESLSATDAIERLRETFEDSVERHLDSDVPLGMFLSSGIDSALIAALAMRERSGERLLSFTIGAQGYNEFANARAIAEHLGTVHTEVELRPETYFAGLPAIAWHFDEPVADPAAIALYFLAERASRDITVVLSGDGADELFGGYRIYREPFAVNRVRNLPKPLRAAALSGGRLPERIPGTNFLRRAALPLETRFIGNAHIFSAGDAAAIWRGAPMTREDLAPLYAHMYGMSDQQKMQFVDIERWLPGDILAKSDKMTMAHSLELRVPFLDLRVAQVASTTPDSLKFADGTTKWLLRKVADEYLPPESTMRPKLGFPVPLADWLRRDPSVLDSMLTNDLIRDRFDAGIITGLIGAHVTGKANNARKLFVLTMLATWYDVFFGDDAGPVSVRSGAGEA